MAEHWQICFDHGHQQRYLPDRQAVLRYVLAIGPRSASTRFEVFAETGAGPAGRWHAGRPQLLIGGSHRPLRWPARRDRLAAELAALASSGGPS